VIINLKIDKLLQRAVGGYGGTFVSHEKSGICPLFLRSNQNKYSSTEVET